MLAAPSALKKLGVMGINTRNAQFILRYNPRRFYPLVDDKLKTKDLALGSGIGVPELYGVIEAEGQVKRITDLLCRLSDFVIKPARGSGGNGILVVKERLESGFRETDGSIMRLDELQYHVFNVLSGLYSLGGQPDKAMVEYRVRFHPVFESVIYQGVPDIRIIVFLGIPVMAMVRLPTRQSRGKANLHQGAIGAGVDMASGVSLAGVWHDRFVSDHPDTGKPVQGITIPYWDQLLEIASGCYEMTGLGYVGVDIVLDVDKGPLVLELNARPGLNIQIANAAGLLPRLQVIENQSALPETLRERVVFCRQRFTSSCRTS